jgi:hypothetical protein
MIFGTSIIESAYAYLNEKLRGSVWLTTTNSQTNVLVSVVLATGGLIELVTE